MQQNHASSADLDADPNKSALGQASQIPLAFTPGCSHWFFFKSSLSSYWGGTQLVSQERLSVAP